ncbi:MAG: hypothetical protein WBN04_17180 [Paracoccaceae bacterium]
MEPAKLLASGWPGVFTALGLGAGSIAALQILNPKGGGANDWSILSNAAGDSLGPGALLALLFFSYLLGEVQILAGSWVFGQRDEDKVRRFVAVALCKNDLLTEEFKTVKQRTDMLVGLMFTVLLVTGLTLVLSWTRIDLTGWIAIGITLVVVAGSYVMQQGEWDDFDGLLYHYEWGLNGFQPDFKKPKTDRKTK